MQKGLVTVCLCLGLLATAMSSADAQYRRPFQVVPRVNRALGHWNGFGYHTCNPGPDSSYYNPWTQKNSFLISQSPEFLSRFGHEQIPTPMELLHSGSTYQQSAYGAQSAYGSDVDVPSTLNADFVPNDRDEDEEDEDIDVDEEFDEDEQEFDEGGEFTPRSEYEDRFDEDAEGIEEGSDPFDEQAEAFEGTQDPGVLGGSDDQEEPSTNGSSTRRDPGSIFLPASHAPSIDW